MFSTVADGARIGHTELVFSCCPGLVSCLVSWGCPCLESCPVSWSCPGLVSCLVSWSCPGLVLSFFEVLSCPSIIAMFRGLLLDWPDNPSN